ncbi:MAG: hypothetical protein QXT46_01225 [Pyrobaculum sp.]|uniref:hypothetical protein n=1 Tax=Pyrobaculum sp. TaxID=2004705 RepID=UPI00317B1BC3
MYAATPYKDPYQYSKEHYTLWGKIGALAHYDVVKTTEPRICSDGAANFTCILSKTDAKPIIVALRKVGVEAETIEINATWVLSLYYNYTAGGWQWRNTTVIKAWELKWHNQTVRIYQVKIKRSLGEMMKIVNRATGRLMLGNITGVTVVGLAGDFIIVGTRNATGGKPDEGTRERIVKEIKGIDPDIEVEVMYTEPNTHLVSDRNKAFDPLVGGIAISFEPGSNGYCTLGYTGLLYGSIPVIVTAWHCVGWIWSSYVEVYQPAGGYERVAYQYKPPGCAYWFENNKLVTTCDIATVAITTRSRAPQIYRPGGFTWAFTEAIWGTVVKVLGRYDVAIGQSVAKAGATTDVTEGALASHYVNVDYGSVVVLGELKAYYTCQAGDSGSPVYRRGWPIGLYSIEIYAYGIHSGGAGEPGKPTNICFFSPLEAYPLRVDYT